MKKFILSLTLTMAAIATAAAAPAMPAATAPTAAPADTAIAADSVRTAALSPAMEQEITKIVRQEMEGFSHSNNVFTEDLMESFIPITAIIMPFLTIIVIAVAMIAAGTKRRRQKYGLVEKAIAANYRIPEYVFNSQSSKTTEANSRKSLNSAIMLIAVGTSLTLFFLVNGALEVASLMLMILLIGLGKLAVEIIDRKKAGKQQQEQQPEKPQTTEEDATQD